MFEVSIADDPRVVRDKMKEMLVNKRCINIVGECGDEAEVIQRI